MTSSRANLVADRLIGLMVCHPDSYLNAAPGGAKWEPQHSVKPNAVTITDMAGMMPASMLMA